MQIDIYKSTTHRGKYLSVPAGSDLSTINFPGGLDPDLLSVSPFAMELDIQSNDGRVGLDLDDVIRQIVDKGFAAHQATITIGLGRGG